MIPCEIQALIRKAKESLEAARGLVRDGHSGFAASRAYYAMFYIAEALLAQMGQSYSSHSGVIAAFGKEFAKSGKLDAKFHRWLIDAGDVRNIGDYGVRLDVPEQQAVSVCEWAEEFIHAAEMYLSESGGTAG
jgi:uncharacterized protein (UPF0332 family)